jgi:CHASE2 domain-containing sensor protein
MDIQPPKSLWRVILGLQKDPNSARVRALACGLVVAVAYAVLGAWALPMAGTLRSLVGEAFKFDAVLGSFGQRAAPPPGVWPVSLVEIDEVTHAAWGKTLQTPRDRLTALVLAVDRMHPAAIVVDISLPALPSGEEPTAADRQLTEAMSSYSGAPVIWVRAVGVGDGATTSVAKVRPSKTRHLLDDVAAKNSRLSFAQTFLTSDSDGTLRRWQEALAVCGGDKVDWLESVPLQVAAVATSLAKGVPVPPPQTAVADCTSSDAIRQRLILSGPRLLGPGNRHLAAQVPVVSAVTLLDANKAFDVGSLFEGRIVIIGNTHSDARDDWRTTAGYMPGMEVVGDIVRFAPLQFRDEQMTYRARGLALVLFGALAVLAYQLRPLLALGAGLLLTLFMISMVIAIWGWIGVFDAIGDSLLLFVHYKALTVFAAFVGEARQHGWRCLRAQRFWTH